MQHIKWFKDFLDAGLDPYAFESFGKFWTAYEKWLYNLKKQDSQYDDPDYIHHLAMLHFQNSIRKIATELYSLFGNQSMTIDHFMCQAASGLYGFMDPIYQSQFDKKYKHLCGNATVQPYDENKFGCHTK